METPVYTATRILTELVRRDQNAADAVNNLVALGLDSGLASQAVSDLVAANASIPQTLTTLGF